MGLKLLQITGTFLTTIWTVPMARSAVSAGFGLPGHLCPAYRVFPSARLCPLYPLGLNMAVHQRLPSGSVVQKHK